MTRPTQGGAARVVRLRPANPPLDADLVHRIRSGDAAAAEILFKRHYRAVTGTVARLIGDSPEADDAAQDALAAAFADLEQLREPGRFRAWLVQVTVRKVHRRFRRRKLRRLLGLESGPPPGGFASLAADDASPDTRAELALLDKALADVPPRDRVPWTLRYVEELALDEVAAACECSLATVKRRIAAAHSRVREHVRIADADGGDDG